MTEPRTPDQRRETPQEMSGERRVIDARQLFGEQQEVWIEHEGACYRLRITRRGKLILQK